ncbi:hypothetical protein [Siccirubricoccus sp. G192]|uniref:hypothetical protein n=1 Tax=Siccirubricoccus sp. G192 TaxID=2849651 RepID=UPI001C2C86E8|nr:hypothetical protein [Siccirubricoccus sp. G192]MBV1796581.1 hypothetical protein [Siccirubricoccus sp. G192]
MPDALSPPLAQAALEVCPHARAAALRFRRALAQGHSCGEALEGIRAYLVVLRPGLPLVLAQEQAEAIAAAVGQSPAPERPPLDLLLTLAAPTQPDDTVPAP